MKTYKIRFENSNTEGSLRAANFWLKASNIVNAAELFMSNFGNILGMDRDEIIQISEVDENQTETRHFR